MKDLIDALQIFLKYTDAMHPTGCEHDVLYVYVSPGDVDADDLKKLNTLGFKPDNNIDCFVSTGFGSG